MRRALFVFLCLAALCLTGVSPAGASRYRTFPPPSVPLDKATEWRTALEIAKDLAKKRNDHAGVLRKLEPFRDWPARYGPNAMATTTLVYLATAHIATYQYNEGMRELLEARRFARITGDNTNLAAAAGLLSNLYSHLFAFAQAEQAADEAMRACPPNSSQMVSVLINKARLASKAGKLDESLRLFHEAIDLATRIPDNRLKAVALRNLGQYMIQANRFDDADSSLRQALAIMKKTRDPNITSAYTSLAELEIARGRFRQAEELIGQAVAAFTAGRTGVPAWYVEYLRSRALAGSGRLGPALDALRLALEDIRESRYHMLPADALRISSFEGAQKVYFDFIDTAAQLHAKSPNPKLLAELLGVIQAERALALRLTAAGSARFRRSLPTAYFETLAALQATHAGAFRAGSAEARERAEALRLQLLEMEAAAGIDQELDLTPDSTAALFRKFSPDEAVLGFHLGPQRSYLWTLTDRGMTIHTLAARPHIAALVPPLREAIEQNSAALRPLSEQLYQELFRDLPPAVRARRRWLLMPDGELFQVPFAALRDPAAGYLVQNHSVQILPGLWMLSRTQNFANWAGPFIGIGDPIYNRGDQRLPRRTSLLPVRPTSVTREGIILNRLVNSASELNVCARSFAPASSRTLLLGADAHWEQVRALLPQRPSVLHFATHVVPSSDSEQESLIALSLTPTGEPELVTPEMIAACDARSRLVVLSGCRSGSGAIKPGEGLMGLTRAWLLAGAGSVLATYWPTLDDSGQLLAGFYESLAARHPHPADALQAAQQAALALNDFHSEPRYWAACFVSTGEL